MKISDKSVVVLTYTLHVEGMVADQATEEKPFDYIQGGHMVLPKLEEAVEGLEEGDSFEVTIGPADAYGEYDPKLRFDLPKSSFSIDGVVREDLLVVGRIIPMIGPDGMVVRAQVVEVKEEAVTVDFNDPMAGKTLEFTGKVVAVRAATEKELTEGLHGEYLPHEGCHGGCHGGCHKGEGEGCCHGGDEDHECHCGEEGHECNCGGDCHCNE